MTTPTASASSGRPPLTPTDERTAAMKHNPTPPCPCGSTEPREAQQDHAGHLAAVCPTCGRTEPVATGEPTLFLM